MEELQQHENQSRFLDIVNVHAAASARKNYDGGDSCLSQDDMLESSRQKHLAGLIDVHGIGYRWGLQQDDEEKNQFL